VSEGTAVKECISDLQVSFGSINPAVSARQHEFVYAAVGRMGGDVAPPQGIVKINCESGKVEGLWMPKENEFCGEPMYAPRRKTPVVVGDESDAMASSVTEDDGYILSVMYNGSAQESEMVVLEAANISAGPIARIPLGVVVPHGLHGCFAPSEDASWSAEEIDRRAKLADKVESRGNKWNEVKSDFSGLGLRLDDFEEYFGDIL